MDTNIERFGLYLTGKQNDDYSDYKGKRKAKSGSSSINVVFCTGNFSLYHVKLALKIHLP